MNSPGLFLGIPPNCDRCGQEDAKIFIHLPTYGERKLCERCLVQVIEKGLQASEPESKPKEDI